MVENITKQVAWGLAAIILCAGFSLAPSAHAAEPAKAVALAIEQSRLAESATDLGGVRARLHGIINCLVGPDDSLYDASGGDQCANLGDTVHAVSADRASLKQLKGALKKAIRGLRTEDPTRAKAYAVEARNLLLSYK